MPAASMITTAEQLFQEAGGLGRCELVRGELLVMSPAGSRHGAVTLRIATMLANHVDDYGLGQVFAAETGFILTRNPDTVRAPDVAFVSRSRLETGLRLSRRRRPTGSLQERGSCGSSIRRLDRSRPMLRTERSLS